jgi:hypothetical protein
MKVYNLTDVSTPVLKQRHLEDQTFSVGGHDVAPGASVDVLDEERGHITAQLAFLIGCGALSVDKIPDSYTSGKQKVLENKYKDIKDTRESANPTPVPPVKVEVKSTHEDLPAPPPVPTTISTPEQPALSPPDEHRLPTTDVPPVRRRGGG